MNIQQAIENREKCLAYLIGCGPNATPENVEAVRLSIEALKEKAEREDHRPLTLEELRQYEGEPVFLVIENIGVKSWMILDFNGDERTHFKGGLRLSNKVYGMAWRAYRHKPKEV